MPGNNGIRVEFTKKIDERSVVVIGEIVGQIASSSPPMRRTKTTREFRLRISVSPGTEAVYLALSGLKVAHTEVKQQWPLITVDHAFDGSVVGIESVGLDDFSIEDLCRLAGVKLTAEMLRGLTVRQERAAPVAAYA